MHQSVSIDIYSVYLFLLKNKLTIYTIRLSTYLIICLVKISRFYKYSV
jgi:hypothetical protein